MMKSEIDFKKYEKEYQRNEYFKRIFQERDHALVLEAKKPKDPFYETASPSKKDYFYQSMGNSSTKKFNGLMEEESPSKTYFPPLGAS